MRLMISGATSTVEEFSRRPDLAPWLGSMVTPNSRNSIERMVSWGLPWCIDNAAFDRARFDAGRFVALCAKAARASVAPVFVTVPDQVGNHDCTAYLFERWQRHLIGLGLWRRLPWAFVLQDGIQSADDVPWDDIAAVFVGGSDDFKDDVLVTCELIPEARRRGKWVHMGRVNGRTRLRLACHADVDSVDGSSLSRFPRTWVPDFVEHIRGFDVEAKQLDALNARLVEQLRQLDADTCVA